MILVKREFILHHTLRFTDHFYFNYGCIVRDVNLFDII